jgi:hypothetical protein
MTASDLKYKHEINFPNSLFFSRNNMKFAGDTMGNFGVRKIYGAKLASQWGGQKCNVYELHRKKTTNKGFYKSFYFRADTFQKVSLES